MVMRFEIATPGRVLFGPGVVKEAAGAAATMGRHAFLVTGRDPERSAGLRAGLQTAGVAVTACPIAGEPSLAQVAAATAAARDARCDVVIGFGGGSALDAAKAVAALVPNPGPVTDYLEVIGLGRPLQRPPLPCIALPTTSGTGSEATRNAVLTATEHRLKISLRGPQLVPRLAIVDPDLTTGLPPVLTASTGLDALTQLIEPFVCSRANPFTDALAREGLTRAARSLRRAFARPDDRAAREDMSVASLFGGLALSGAGLGAAHGFASPVGGRYGGPHGAICGALLAPSIEANLRAARALGPSAPTVVRYAEVARILTGRADAMPEDALAWIRSLVSEFAIPGLRAYGASEADADAVSAQAANTSSMKANPVPLSAGDLKAIFLAAL